MLEKNMRLFEIAMKFKRLNLVENLSLIPQSELLILHNLLEFSLETGGKNPTVSEIAKRIHVTPPAISRTLRKLREKGMVDSAPDENDRRNTVIRLTEKGRAILKEDLRRISDLIWRALKNLEPGELCQFYYLFDKIYDCIQAEMEKLNLDASPPSGTGL